MDMRGRQRIKAVTGTMKIRFLYASFITLLTISSAIPPAMSATAQEGKRGARTRMVEPNVYAPDLYADNLRMKFTLVNLPGSAEPGSYWEVSYRLYFIPEAAYRGEIMRQARGARSAAGPPQYPRQVLLAKGEFRKKDIDTLKDRTHVLNAVRFKSKVPNRERTKFAVLMTVYSVKIYDARLKTTAYHSSYFETNPFTDDPVQPRLAVPRATIYTSFYLSPKGNIWGSQLPREGDDTTW